MIVEQTKEKKLIEFLSLPETTMLEHIVYFSPPKKNKQTENKEIFAKPTYCTMMKRKLNDIIVNYTEKCDC